MELIVDAVTVIGNVVKNDWKLRATLNTAHIRDFYSRNFLSLEFCPYIQHAM